MEEKRIQFLFVRVSETEKAAVAEAAKRAVMGVSEWVRRVLSKAAAKSEAAAAAKRAAGK